MVRGSSSTSSRTIDASRSRSTPVSRFRKTWISRSRAGCTKGRRVRQSSAVWVWIVDRMVTIRTASRAAIAADSSPGVNPSSRAASA
ncbi:hypothetical protein GCM10020256_13280 [Streptomyces thermocoprophilus]